MAQFQPGQNPFAKKLAPVASPQSNANNQSQMDAVKRRLKKKSDPGDAQDKAQGIKDSPAEDAADAKKKKKLSPSMPMMGMSN